LGKAQAGSKVILIGASGGVGTFAVQVAKAMGCHVTAVCSSRNTALVNSLGADAVIDYTQGDYRQNHGPFDLVYDITSFESPASAKHLMGKKGIFVSTMGSPQAAIKARLQAPRRAKVIQVESYRQDLETLSHWVNTGKLKPVIDSEFDFKDTQKAYERSATGRARGKIVIQVKNT
ncbi:MAG: NAD(P)-dependent alcohol dehydrogenase, partial [Limnobacter sp.]|nr:NAD(P)-dependent alcohol dehydrogenase [Limnobacter sp.]